MVPSVLRLRFLMCREDRPRSKGTSELSARSSLSSGLRLRLGAGGWAAGVAVVATGSSSVAGGRWSWDSWAESSGEGEAGEGGMVGRSEAFGEGRFGAVSSARTNAGQMLPAMMRVHVGRGGGALRWRAVGMSGGS